MDTCCSFIKPPGQGFLPRETALHHQEWAVRLVQQALADAKISPQDISVIAFTKVWPLGWLPCMVLGWACCCIDSGFEHLKLQLDLAHTTSRAECGVKGMHR